MYLDNLTNVSLLAFAITLGSFAYACILHGCVTESTGHRRETGLRRMKTITLITRRPSGE